MTDSADSHRFAVGQRVRSKGPAHAGEVGTIRKQWPGSSPHYLVVFGGGMLVFLPETNLEPAPDGKAS